MIAPSPPETALPPLRYAERWNVIGLIGVAALVWGSLTPSLPPIALDPGNWSGHGVAYGGLMAWFACIHRARTARLALALALAALGVLLEFAQGMTAWRVFDPFDIVANGLGVAVGWLASPPRVPNVVLLLEHRLQRRRGG
jgi:hypothetical protein